MYLFITIQQWILKKSIKLSQTKHLNVIKYNFIFKEEDEIRYFKSVIKNI